MLRKGLIGGSPKLLKPRATAAEVVETQDY